MWEAGIFYGRYLGLIFVYKYFLYVTIRIQDKVSSAFYRLLKYNVLFMNFNFQTIIVFILKITFISYKVKWEVHKIQIPT